MNNLFLSFFELLFVRGLVHFFYILQLKYKTIVILVSIFEILDFNQGSETPNLFLLFDKIVNLQSLEEGLDPYL